ncbi:MAG: sugar phosphate nucleotidyltransferase [Anaerolineae bacterium]
MAGGAGSRLRPLTVGRPKPVVPIVNKPVIGHIRDLLVRHRFDHLIVTLHYMPDQIQNHLADSTDVGITIDYSVEDSPLGTAGSVKRVERDLDDTFLVISGDALTNFDLGAIIRWHKERQSKATIVLSRVKEPPEYGVVITDQNGRIVRFQEKPSWSEVQSDTVNTGIYVLEPSVLSLIPPETPFDFSQDLFPRLLANDEAMYGYVADGYWTDVGTLREYMQANTDVLRGAVSGISLGQHIGGDIWTEGDVEIAPDAQLYGPIYLGEGVRIKGGVVIQGPAVIRANTVVDDRAYIGNTIIWRNCYIGEMADVRGAVICQGCDLKSKTAVYEGAVIGDRVHIGENAVIHAGVKIWPSKGVEAGANIRSSIIWGSQARRTLFTRFGVSGLVNVDLTPEFAAKLGAAYGSVLPKGATVTINRDVSRSARMLKRGIISGLPSAGISPLDTDAVPIPVARYYTSKRHAAGGIHVRISPYDSRVVDIRFYDGDGMNLSKSVERAIERVFFREDYRRVYLGDIGSIDHAPGVAEQYLSDYMRALNVPAIRNAEFQLVVDCANSPTGTILPRALTDLHSGVVALNAQLDEQRMSITHDDFRAGLDQLRLITQTLTADLGVRLDVGGERLFVVDDLGRHVPEMQMAAAFAWLAMRAQPGGMIAVPMNAPRVFERMAAEFNGRIWRTRLDQTELMQCAREKDVVLAADGFGNVIFPSFHPTIDGMFAVAKLLEYLACEKIKLSQVVDSVPAFFTNWRQVNCPWEERGKLMRRLHEEFYSVRDQESEAIQITRSEDEWILIVPSADDPHVMIYAEATSEPRAVNLVDEYAVIVRRLLEQ